MAHPGPDNLTLTVTLPRTARSEVKSALSLAATRANTRCEPHTWKFFTSLINKLDIAERKASLNDKLGRLPRKPAPRTKE